MPNDNEKVTRKLRAILSADVKGYSLLIADDETFTIKTLKEYRGIMSSLIQDHNGRVVDSPGDNLLAEFSSAVDAVECAVKIQKRLRDKNDQLEDDKKLQYRVGVNIGDVVQDGDRIYGSGVNVAARIEGLAEPGGICISRNTYDHIKDKLKFGYEYLGDHEVKNIKDPVRVYKVLMGAEDAGTLIGEKKKLSKLKLIFIIVTGIAVIFVGVSGGLYWKYLYLPSPENIDPDNNMVFNLPKGPSLAVLPFENMTGDDEMEYLCDGITDNIISALSYIPEMFVIARNSTFAYKNRNLNIQQIAKELDARYIIEGSIQKSSQKIRIIVQLINAISGVHEWTETYDRELIDILQLQDEIAFEILNALNVKLTAKGNYHTIGKGLTNLNELQKTLKGWNILFQSNPESYKLAQSLAEELIEENPHNIDALILKSQSYIYDAMTGGCSDNPLLCIGKATEALRRAFSIDKTFYRAHMSASNLFLFRKEFDKAIDSIKMTISINPNFANAYCFYGFIYTMIDEPDNALDYINKAFRLNPVPPHYYYYFLGQAHMVARNYRDAINASNECLKLFPDYYMAYVLQAIAYGHLGDKERAEASLSNLLRLNPNFSKKNIKPYPFKKDTTREIFYEGLSKAGMTD
jgi:adenylate cyclase